MRLEFIELHVFDKRGSIVTAVNRPGLKRGWCVRPGQRDGLGAEGLESGKHHLILRGADLKAFHIGHGVDGAFGVVKIAV